jgi:hypothetical protein
MQEHINELVKILSNTEGITYITQRIVKTQVHFSFIFESYKVLDDLKQKMPEDWFLFIVGSHNICYLSYKQSDLERYFELQQLVNLLFYSMIL